MEVTSENWITLQSMHNLFMGPARGRIGAVFPTVLKLHCYVVVFRIAKKVLDGEVLFV